MKRFYLALLCCALLFFQAQSQTVITTKAKSISGNYYAMGITFVVENTNSHAVLLDKVGFYIQNEYYASFDHMLWYSKTSLSGAGDIMEPDWELLKTTIPTIGEDAIYNDAFTSIGLSIPAGAVYRFCVQSYGDVAYATAADAEGNTYTAEGINIRVGDYAINGMPVGFTGVWDPLMLDNANRFFVGSVSFLPPCTEPPVAGVVNQSPIRSMYCAGENIGLSVTGQSLAAGLTYQWQSAATENGTYTNFGEVLDNASTTITTTNTDLYYRCGVTCGASTAYTNALLIKSNPGGFAGGVYTINAAQATGGTNFRSFNDAVNAMRCGITGAVTFNVAAGSGPYNEQVLVEAIPGASAVNTITFNGNGDTLKYVSAIAKDYTLKLDGADHLNINNLHISSLGNPDAWTVVFANNADSNRIFASSIISDSTTEGGAQGITFSSTQECGTCDGPTGSYNTFENNRIVGSRISISIIGSAEYPASHNRFIGNRFTDFYMMGVYWLSNNNNTLIEGNDFSRPTRTSDGGLVFVMSSQVFESNRQILVKKNRIHALSAGNVTSTGEMYGISFDGPGEAAARHRVENNLIYDIKSSAGIAAIQVNSYTDVYHNTVVLDDVEALTGSGSATTGITVKGSAGTSSVKNNIVYITRVGNGSKTALVFDTKAQSDKNVLYVKSRQGVGGQYLGRYEGKNIATLPLWQVQAKADAGSFSVNPLFKNDSYAPSVGLIDNIGDDLGVLQDIDNKARTSTPDAGALEFTAAAGVLDAGIDWLGPQMPAAAGQHSVKVKITNYQTVRINSVSLSYTNGTVVETQLFEGLSIAPSASHELSFTTPYVLNGSASLYAYINKVNGVNDSYSANDTTAVQDICVALPTGTYTINAAQATGNGNYQSFTEAVGSLVCGVTGPVVFNVAAGSGPYSEQVSIPAVYGASSINTITFNGNNDTLSLANYNIANRYILQLDGADHIVVKNLNIVSGKGSLGYGIQLINAADSNTIENCVVVSDTAGTDANHFGIVIGGSSADYSERGSPGSHNLFIGNTILGGSTGVIVYGAEAEESAYGNKFVGNKIYDFYATGIMLDGAHASQITGNDIQRPTRRSGGILYGVAIYTFATGNVIDKNKMHDFTKSYTTGSAQYSFYNSYFTSVQGKENIFSSNVIYGLTGTSTMYGFYNRYTVSYTKFLHNTIVFDSVGQTAGTSYGIHFNMDGAEGVELRNNLIYTLRRGNAFGISLNDGAKKIISTNNNIFFAGTGNRFFGSLNGQASNSLDGWKATGYDNGSVSIDPIFTNIAAADFKPTNAAFDNLGIAAGVAEDAANVGRALPPDIGAYEFGTALPVKLGNFNAVLQNENVLVEWVTLTETNSSHFVVERSFDGNNFSAAGTVKATGAGNYNLTDPGAMALNHILYYRLQIVDKDGSVTYSGVAVVTPGANQVNVVSAYPNPMQGGATLVRLQSANAGAAVIRVIDMQGRTVVTKYTAVLQGQNKISIALPQGASKGMYQLVVDVNKEHFAIKLVN